MDREVRDERAAILSEILRQMALPTPVGKEKMEPFPTSILNLAILKVLQTPADEVEIRFGSFRNSSFQASVPFSFWHALRIASGAETVESDVVEIDGPIRRRTYADNTVIFERKTKGVARIDVPEWGIRVDCSNEEIISPPTRFNPTLRRERTRWSKVIPIGSSRWVLEMTKVVTDGDGIFEVELEKKSEGLLNESDESALETFLLSILSVFSSPVPPSSMTTGSRPLSTPEKEMLEQRLIDLVGEGGSRALTASQREAIETVRKTLSEVSGTRARPLSSREKKEIAGDLTLEPREPLISLLIDSVDYHPPKPLTPSQLSAIEKLISSFSRTSAPPSFRKELLTVRDSVFESDPLRVVPLTLEQKRAQLSAAIARSRLDLSKDAEAKVVNALIETMIVDPPRPLTAFEKMKIESLLSKSTNPTDKFIRKAVNIKLSDLLDPEFDTRVGMVKYDGMRKFLLLTDLGAFYYSPPGIWSEVEGFGEVKEAFRGTLLDGELLSTPKGQKYVAFDLLFLRSRDVRRELLISRIGKLRGIPGIEVASMFPVSNRNLMVEKLNAERDRLHRMSIETDGYILVPSGSYSEPRSRKNKEESARSSLLLKWKPSSHLTIDFRVDGGYLYFGNEDSKLTRFKGTVLHPFTSKVESDGYDGFIVEMQWTGDTFRPLRIRYDKTAPNFKSVVLSVWYDIWNPVTLASITGRNLDLFDEASNIFRTDLLEIGLKAGKRLLVLGPGGEDAAKWKKLGVESLTLINPGALPRIPGLPVPIVVETIPSEKDSFDLVTAFSGFDFAVDSLKETFSALSRSVRSGGKVIILDIDYVRLVDKFTSIATSLGMDDEEKVTWSVDGLFELTSEQPLSASRLGTPYTMSLAGKPAVEKKMVDFRKVIASAIASSFSLVDSAFLDGTKTPLFPNWSLFSNLPPALHALASVYRCVMFSRV